MGSVLSAYFAAAIFTLEDWRILADTDEGGYFSGNKFHDLNQRILALETRFGLPPEHSPSALNVKVSAFASRIEMKRYSQGFSLIEVLIAISVILALGAIAIQQYGSYRSAGDIGIAVIELRSLATQIQSYKLNNDKLPTSLSDLPPPVTMADPWGGTYQYLNIEDADIKGKGQLRKDKNLVPINSDFDLYSMGADGKTVAPLTAKASHDDIVRANDGGYYGLASKY